jgi:hypothetical protein
VWHEATLLLRQAKTQLPASKPERGRYRRHSVDCGGLGPLHVNHFINSSFLPLSFRPFNQDHSIPFILTEFYAQQVQPGLGTTICISRRGTVIPAVNSRWQLPQQWNRMRAWHRLRLVSHSQCSIAREHIDTGRDLSPIVNAPLHEPLSTTPLAGLVLWDDRQLSCHCSSSPAPTDASRSVEESRMIASTSLRFASGAQGAWLLETGVWLPPYPRYTPPLPLVIALGERGESSGMTANRDVIRRTASQFMHVYSCISYHQGRSTG